MYVPIERIQFLVRIISEFHTMNKCSSVTSITTQCTWLLKQQHYHGIHSKFEIQMHIHYFSSTLHCSDYTFINSSNCFSRDVRMIFWECFSKKKSSDRKSVKSTFAGLHSFKIRHLERMALIWKMMYRKKTSTIFRDLKI